LKYHGKYHGEQARADQVVIGTVLAAMPTVLHSFGSAYRPPAPGG
jgi:hypothetical protein